MKGKLLFLFLVISFLFSFIEVRAQQSFCENAFKGDFTIDPGEGCVQKAVTLKSAKSGAQDVYYVYNFNRAQTEAPALVDRTPDLSYVYTKPGTYTILQAGSANGTGFVLCKDYKVRETAAPLADIVTCKSGKVRLTLTDNDIAKAYDQIEINWGDGTKAYWSKGKSFIYDKTFSGTVPSIELKGLYTNGLCDADIKKTVLNGLVTPPLLSSIKINIVEMTADGKARIVYTGMEGTSTELFMDGVSTGKTSSQSGPQTATIENLDPKKVYKFKLVSKDICDNLVDSPVVSSVALEKGVLVVDEANSLTWNQYSTSGQSIQYQLLRKINGSQDAPTLAFATPTALSYLDDKVTCGEKYEYSLVVIDGDVRSYSAPLVEQPTSSSPEKIQKASITVESNSMISSVVELSGAGLTNTYNLIVERANAGSSDFQSISGVGNQSLVYKDNNVNTSETSYCYRFSYENSCKQTSPPSDAVCSILLKNNIQDISWTGASPFTSGIASYDLIETDANGRVTNEIPKQLDLSHKIDLATQSSSGFQIKAHSSDGNLVSYSNVISLQNDAIMLVPDAFTPNGDGINERFEVKSYFTDTFRMLIYSRWGEVIFQSENALDGWDGTVKGKPAAPGYYLYKIEASTSTQQQISKTGSLMLIR